MESMLGSLKLKNSGSNEFFPIRLTARGFSRFWGGGGGVLVSYPVTLFHFITVFVKQPNPSRYLALLGNNG